MKYAKELLGSTILAILVVTIVTNVDMVLRALIRHGELPEYGLAWIMVIVFGPMTFFGLLSSIPLAPIHLVLLKHLRRSGTQHIPLWSAIAAGVLALMVTGLWRVVSPYDWFVGGSSVTFGAIAYGAIKGRLLTRAQ